MDEKKGIDLKKFLLPTIGCSLPSFLIIFSIFASALILLGIINSEAGNGSSLTKLYSYQINGEVISGDIKVRLLKCEGYDYIDGEGLIDFETYITGVVYQENGNASYEALKAQAVAARSYALTRPSNMGNAFGLNLEEQNGTWILSIRNCTNDQVFCHPDKGCWSKVAGGQTGNGVADEDCTIYSGENSSPVWSRASASEESLVRQAVEETAGQVLIDKTTGNVLSTGYVSSVQNKWNQDANNGSDYFEILVGTYGENIKLSQIVESIDSVLPEIDDVDIQTLINMSDSEAWYALTGKQTTKAPYVTESEMNQRVITITVPVRKYASDDPNDFSKVTQNVNITVNKALANLWTAFFTDIYNEAPDFVIGLLGCNDYRDARNSSTLSAHAYGAACDINWTTEGNLYGPYAKVYTKEEWETLPETKEKYKIIYLDSKVAQIAHKYTLSWGGEWTTPKDGMHFSFIRDETRATLQNRYKR